MKFQNTAILSLGSNIGNRLSHLQDAVNYIHNHIATVVKVSAVYETPALGFEGAPFYNCAIVLHTIKTPQDVLLGILEAEQEGGRVRSASGGYASRTIDVDIIAYNDEVIHTPQLQIPHPRMQERNFVLYPMKDVAPHWQHPVLKAGVKELLQNTTDMSSCKPVEKLELPGVGLNPSRFNYIAIEGNIGAGKTTLATKISEDFNARLILERFADNPFLPKFYEDGQRYAFPLEMSFLADRYQQITDDLAQFDLFTDFIVADYHIFKSLIFSRVTLAEEEYRLYRRLFDIMYKELPKPGLYIYLHQNTERLLEHIKMRGRSYEQNINAAYLDKINSGYTEYIRAAPGLNVLIIDVTSRDFVNRQEDYIWLLNQIGQHR
ncbi:2-amino-4-hydroxy-6-hydroxymethyldihydropteridine diphosphokinase [Flavobacterium rhizosphaerae]|uniref:2-amino-4-hydroxy-6-hydroxymethyldihydropteridine pyrophosphokinase n=1 Tax=Flavobacterium rhizosphaerae TaxID=3163298 RepID=A0ABW8YWK2_9FLAO